MAEARKLLGPGSAPRPHARQRAAWAWGAGGLPATWGALGGGAHGRGKAGALSNSAPATAGQAAAWQLSEQEAGLEGVRDDDREGGGATVRVHLGCRWQGREGLSAK